MKIQRTGQLNKIKHNVLFKTSKHSDKGRLWKQYYSCSIEKKNIDRGYISELKNVRKMHCESRNQEKKCKVNSYKHIAQYYSTKTHTHTTSNQTFSVESSGKKEVNSWLTIVYLYHVSRNYHIMHWERSKSYAY